MTEQEKVGAEVKEKVDNAEKLPKAEDPASKESTKGVSKKEFASFQESVTSALGAIMERLDDKKPTEAASKQKDDDYSDAGPQTMVPVPPKWREMTDEILGKDFDIELELPENGGQKFSVYVPMAKSNAHPDYKKEFKKDKRTRELGNTGVKGVREWLIRIRKNLVNSGVQLPYFQDNSPTLISTR